VRAALKAEASTSAHERRGVGARCRRTRRPDRKGPGVDDAREGHIDAPLDVHVVHRIRGAGSQDLVDRRDVFEDD